MLICKDCGYTFQEPVTRTEYTGVNSEGFHEKIRYDVCPHCSSDEVNDAVRCDVCGEWADDYLCDDCRQYIRGRLEAAVSDMVQTLKADRSDVLWGVSEEIEKME